MGHRREELRRDQERERWLVGLVEVVENTKNVAVFSYL